VFLVEVQKHSVKVRLTKADTGYVKVLALSTDGKYLATDVGVWDFSAGKFVAQLRGHSGNISCLAFALDGKVLVSAGDYRDKTVRLYDTAKWEATKVIETSGFRMCVSSDGKMLATNNGRDDVVRFWDVESGKKVGELEAGALIINAMTFSPDGKRLAVGSTSRTVRQFDIATGKEVRSLPGHREGVTTVVFSPDGKTLASRGTGRTIRFWDPATGKELRQIAMGEGLHNGYLIYPYGLAFTPDWTKLAILGAKAPLGQGASDSTYRVLDVKTGDPLYTYSEEHRPGAQPHPPHALAVSPDGRVLAASYWAVRLFSLKTGEELPPIKALALSVAFSPDGRTLALGMDTIKNADNLQLWDWTTGQMLRSLRGHQRDRVPNSVTALSFSPGGHYLATCGGSNGGTAQMNYDISIWEVASGMQVRNFRGHEGTVCCIALSPNGRMLASAGYGDKTVRVWDVFTGKEIAKFAGHSGPVNTVAWSPDGKMLASGSSDTTILVWDTSRLKVELPATEGKPEQLAKLWDDLRQHESAKAFDALWSLAGAGDKAAELFDGKLKPAAAPDAAKLKKLLADLGDDKPEVRDAASEGLSKLGPLAEPALREKRKEEKLDAEVRKRIDELLEKLGKREATDDELRDGRAVLALELIGTARCRDVLRKLADGADGAPLTREAKAALKRLSKTDR
jgi:WD40 repeat protein